MVMKMKMSCWLDAAKKEMLGFVKRQQLFTVVGPTHELGAVALIPPSLPRRSISVWSTHIIDDDHPHPFADQPVVEEPVAEETAVEEPVVDQPVAEEETAAEEPVAEETAAEEPVKSVDHTVKSADHTMEEPVADQTVVEEPVKSADHTVKSAVEPVDATLNKKMQSARVRKDAPVQWYESQDYKSSSISTYGPITEVKADVDFAATIMRAENIKGVSFQCSVNTTITITPTANLTPNEVAGIMATVSTKLSALVRAAAV